jgi:hypothetical protein
LKLGSFYLNICFGIGEFAPKPLLGIGMSMPKQMCHPDRSVAQWRDLLFSKLINEL